MALNDNATLVVNSGNFFTAPVGTVIPTDLTTIPVGWENVGHTSLEDVFAIDTEGGDSSVLGTLQNKALRTTREAKSDSFTINVQQFDIETLKLYHGSNAVENPDGTLGVPQAPAPTVKAFLAVFTDGSNVFAIYAPKAEILGGDTMEFKDTTSLASLPLRVTPVVSGTNAFAYAITPLDVVEV